MALGILGQKLGMGSFFQQNGRVVAVTVVEAGPCSVVQQKTPSRDGYAALQLAYQTARKGNRPLKGHLQKAGLEKPVRFLREFRINEEELNQYPTGKEVTAAIFKEGENVVVSGNSIGKGFQGVVKRHGFRGGAATHGSMSHRAPGSIGTTNPDHVIKGRKMAGRMGGKRVTIRGLKIIKIEPERNLIFLQGAVPGAEGGLLEIKKEK